ncbi:MAG TPA: maleylpyruvate isomerase family mycothiol-dependent enzyme [Actinomycetota bacterium]|nr:maleylpyruvate isomerase family mycothiol-dependent enzyme [Actinomycetota bacterium]
MERDELLAVARHERDALGRTVQYMPPDRWLVESPSHGWPVKDALAHLAASEVAAAALVGGEEATELEEYRKSLDGEPVTPDGWTEWSVARRAEESPVAVGLEWGRAADLLLSRAAAASDEDWRDLEIPWVAGDIRLRYLVQARVAEWWVHGEDLREGGALPPRLEHWPVYTVNDLAIRLIPYSLSMASRSFPGKVIRVALQGVGEGTWLAPTEPGREAAAGSSFDAEIVGRGYAFASVAGGRADADVCLYEGLLNYGGDVELGEAVLHSLRSFP